MTAALSLRDDAMREPLCMHSDSEAVLHRWDLVGDNDVGVSLLSDPAMVTHALAVRTQTRNSRQRMSLGR